MNWHTQLLSEKWSQNIKRSGDEKMIEEYFSELGDILKVVNAECIVTYM